ncbi:MAG TPA: GNAT family N-acetyltransferase [Actinomycetes bacterium]|jgi:predicted acetyltransferase|nr:GNAT family N-acetyltransferase [Actinomycetes bacterium]
MDIEIRSIAADEMKAYVRVLSAAFGETFPDEQADDEMKTFELDRSIAAFDAGRIVGTGGAYSMELTLPGPASRASDERASRASGELAPRASGEPALPASSGPATVPVGGLTAIAVLPTHRRRGILRAIMLRHFEDVESRGEPVSVLFASESLIYGRFGYGLATLQAWYNVDPRRAAFDRVPAPGGRTRLVEGEEAQRLLPEVYDRWRRVQPGELSRSPARWEVELRDPEWMRRPGTTGRLDVVYESEPGHADGYATYRVESSWANGFATGTARVGELFALTNEAAAGLYRYCLDLDLVGTVQFERRPVDEPLRWLLADPRRLRVTEMTDGLWVRLLDLPAALAARRYAVPGSVVFQVADRLRPANDGRFLLEGGPDGAECRPTGREPDLVCDVADLGAAYLGGIRLGSLAQAGRVLEQVPGALARADAMLATDPAPWCTTTF